MARRPSKAGYMLENGGVANIVLVRDMVKIGMWIMSTMHC